MNALLEQVQRIGREVARPAAADVDERARFPREAFAALKEAKVLGAAVPEEAGGPGLPIRDLGEQCAALGQHCSAAAMILAMHHIQVATIARHHQGQKDLLAYLGSVQDEQRLIASVTSEVGPSGDMRRSVCAVAAADKGRSKLEKQATTISYGEHADDLLITARKNADAAANDQVAVLAKQGEYTLERRGDWNTLGMRGTCSPGALVRWEGPDANILPEPFGPIATETMVPYSHILWAYCWLGIATGARTIAGKSVRARARKTPGSMPAEARAFSELSGRIDAMASNIEGTAREYEVAAAEGDRDKLQSIGFAIRLNNIKLLASEAVVDVVTAAMRVTGIAAYKNDGELSLGRQLRDAHSAALMISNERIHATNASLLLVHKGV